MDTAIKGKKQNATYISQFFSNKNIQKDTFSAVVQNNHENWHNGVLKQLCKNIHIPSHNAMHWGRTPVENITLGGEEI